MIETSMSLGSTLTLLVLIGLASYFSPDIKRTSSPLLVVACIAIATFCVLHYLFGFQYKESVIFVIAGVIAIFL